MTELTRTHLDTLENQSLFIFREAYHAFKNIAMPWSIGKDSSLLIWLARKAFFVRVPLPVLINDPTLIFPETQDLPEWATKYHNLTPIVQINRDACASGIGYTILHPLTVTHSLT